MIVEIVMASLLPQAKEVLALATTYAIDLLEPDGYWCGELLSDVTVTSEYIFVLQSINHDFTVDGEAYRVYLLSQQKSDGSWSLAVDYPGDVSTTAEAYLALKILGLLPSHAAMQQAQEFILKVGGLSRIRMLTRIFFAIFGLIAWNDVPELPAELILFPSYFPINIYKLSAWARSTIVPILIVRHHQPIYALPNGTSPSNTFLDELWPDADNKAAPYGTSLREAWEKDIFAFGFGLADKLLYSLQRLLPFPLRSYARRQCVEWIIQHQEVNGDWAGIMPPMIGGIQALLLEGYTIEDPEIKKGLEAIERFMVVHDGGRRLQPSISPVWDTVQMIRALCEAGFPQNHDILRRAVKWSMGHQLHEPRGDWRVYKPRLGGGGFSFQGLTVNSWYPDVDDTACAVMAFIHQNPASIDSTTAARAIDWLCGMQNSDGGWGAFDYANDYQFLNKIPFNDMGNLCDPSTADITGRILETFGLIIQTARQEHISPGILERIKVAADRGISCLVELQEAMGAWYGRWGVNYIYGTSNVLCGLSYFKEHSVVVSEMISSGVSWLKLVQNEDGGWGEDPMSYKDTTRAGRGDSTPSQTAWALMGLLGHISPTEDFIGAGIKYLLQNQTRKVGSGATWPETKYTGTGFPGHFYLFYTFYSHYFPMMALGRYSRAIQVLGEKPVDMA